MLLFALAVTLLATLGLIAVRRRHVGRLTSFATLVAAIMLMIWLQDSGLLPGMQGPLSGERARTSLDAP
ncbi:hypothetical protein [Methylobacterium flocculans]|uniref:hypothetical protein n=1 Tax=Methylobacterium flocculans TaxID=2984843 RepID=UPI0021F29367|nr:hypothetical protein [Methylobacterium sp. FF17]